MAKKTETEQGTDSKTEQGTDSKPESEQKPESKTETKSKRPTVNLLKKLSSATIMEGKIRINEDERRYLYRIAGKATGLDAGTAKFGDWESLTGEFVAKRHDGKIFMSGVAFIPDPVHTMIASQVKQNVGSSVEVKVDIFAVADDESNTGYVYEAVDLLGAKNDALLDLLE